MPRWIHILDLTGPDKSLRRNVLVEKQEYVSIRTQSAVITVTEKKEDNDGFRMPNEKKQRKAASLNPEFELTLLNPFSLLQEHLSKKVTVVGNSGNSASASSESA